MMTATFLEHLGMVGPILENKGMCRIFQKKKYIQKRAKKCKIFKNLGKNIQNLKIF